MFAIDLKTGDLLYNWDIKAKVANEFPYGEWLSKHRVHIAENKGYKTETQYEKGDLLQE